MEQSSNKIETKVQLHYRYLYLIFGSLAILFIVALFFLTYIGQGSGTIIYFFVWILALIAWFVYVSIIVKKLTKRLVFIFEKKLSIQIFDLKTGALQEEHQFAYTDIKSCFLSSGSSKTCTFKLNFFDGGNLKLVLYSSEGEFTNAKNIVGLKIFQQLFTINPNIQADKPFFISRNGNIAILLLATLFAVNIITNIIFHFHSNSFLISLPTTISILLMIVVTRKKQQITYNEMNALLNNKIPQI
jgi:hypothetical protein